MSEFTAGILFLNRDTVPIAEGVGSVPAAGFRIERLNEKWGVVLTADTFLSQTATLEGLVALSRKAPVLFFYNAEDHGWGYRIMHEGQTRASFDLNYDLEDEFYRQAAGERYPGEDPYALPQEAVEELFDAVQQSEAYQAQEAAQYRSLGLQEFALFGVEPEALEAIFAREHRDGLEIIHELVAEFKKTAGLEEMSWVHYETDFSERRQ